MAKEKVGKYAAKLRELGFKPIEELHSKADIDEVDLPLEKLFGTRVPHKLSRADRRKLIAMGVLPNFARIQGDTQAFDERGREWWALGQLIDLTPFGFSDTVKYFEEKEAARKKQLN